MKPIGILTTFIAFTLVGSLRAGELNELINHYAALAKTQDVLFDGFDVGRGKSLYMTGRKTRHPALRAILMIQLRWEKPGPVRQ